ncbi:MAG: Ig-like domain-containing protein, partial [Anaerolineales bacterium]|nr:Ig-like domain-containing protein [Anaerolineales bacterium]
LLTYEVSFARYLASATGKTFSARPSWELMAHVTPKVVTRAPAGPEFPLGTKEITLVFSHDMDQASVENAFTIEPALPHTFTWTKKTLKITLDTTFTPEQALHISLSDSAKTLGGEFIPSLAWTYTTPALHATFGRANTASRLTPFTVTFNYPVAPTTIESALTLNPTFPYKPQWDTKNQTLTLTPTEPLPAAENYTFTLNLENAVGDPAPHTWDYLTPAVTANLEIIPRGERRPRLKFTTDIALDPESLANALRITPAMTYTLEWASNHTSFSILPATPLPSLTQYTIRFEGTLLDADGFPLPGLGIHRFTTPSPIANEPVLEWQYTNWNYYFGAAPLSPNGDFIIQFDRPMDPATIVAALTITPSIPGETVWTDATHLQILPTEGHLQPLTEYTLTLAPTALDAEGNPVLSAPHTWKIPIADFPSQASFGEYGANVQVVDLDGRRAIQIATNGGLETVHLDLYRITIADFLQYDANTFVVPWASGRNTNNFDLSGAAHVASWDSEVVYVTGENAYNHPAEIYLPEDLDEGLYVINLTTDHLDDQMLLVASRSTLAVQFTSRAQGGGDLIAWVSNINGFVMPDADVRVYTASGMQVASGTTDENGVFQTTLPAGITPSLVVARRDGGITATGIGGVWGSRGSTGFRTNTANQYTVYLYTERPIYRPDQTVNYKGIVRLDNDVNFRLPPAGITATLNIRDARNNLIATTPVTLNTFGTFNGAFTLAPGAMLGEYQLELLFNEESHWQSFKVQDYKKPDIAITITPDRAEYVAGDTMSFTVDTRYLFGEPVANASLKVNTYELLPFYCCYWDDYPGGGNGEFRWFPSGAEITLTADENGLATFTLPAQMGEQTQSRYYYRENAPITTHWGIEVTADDGSNQEISSFATVRVHNTATEAEIQLGGWLFRPNTPFPVRVLLSSTFGDPLNRPVQFRVEKRSGSYWDYTKIQTLDLTPAENGLATTELTLENGSYRLTLTGEDSQGNAFETSRHLYVFEPESTWLLDYTTELSVYAEARAYAPGDTAEIVVESSFSGQALVTIARGSILDHRLVQLTAPLTVLNVPIRTDYAPNIFVIVEAWNPLVTDLNQYEYAYESIPDSILRRDAVQLTVPDTAHRLTVEITPDKAEYAPREDAAFTIRVTDPDGNPVRAELSLALVDEAIFLLADDPAGDIHDAFYTPRSLSLFSSDSLAPWRFLWFSRGEGGGGGDDFMPGSPRTDFPDTALWLPTVVTDADGTATITVTLPDTLTSWRLTVKAITQTSLSGEGQTNIVTQQPLVVRPLPPRNLVAGDTFLLSALVHNFSDQIQAITVRAASDGLELDDAPQQIILHAGASGVVNWTGTATRAGETSFTITAATTFGMGDAVEMHLPVQPLMIPVTTHEAGQFTGSARVTVSPAPGALPESGVQVQVDATLAGSLLTGVEYLVGYPYGCVEQTMSRALPNAVVARAFEQLGLSERADLLGLDGKLAASVQRLYAFQHDDGGWGWWFDDPSDGYQTAWVVFGLSVTAESGYPIDRDVIARGADYLKENLDGMNAPTRAFAVYALALSGHGDLQTTFNQTASLSELDLFSRASLALALHELGDDTTANELLDGILSEMEVAPDGSVFAPGADHDGYYSAKFMSSSVRTTAMVLRAVMALRPDSDLRPGMVQGLQARRATFGWGTTNETAFTLLALTDHLLAQQAAVADTTVSVYLNDILLQTSTLSAGTPSLHLSIPVATLAAGENEIRLETDAAFPLYYSVNGEMFVAQTEIAGEGLPVTRQYLDPETKQPLTTLREGDLVLVRLTVDLPQTGFYLMLTDPLPGGLEALNEGLNITGHDTVLTERSYWGYEWDWFTYDDYGYNNKEIWADRVLFFVTEMGAGPHVFEYYARATVSGVFTALPAEIEAMYDLAFWGRSGSEVVVVREGENN